MDKRDRIYLMDAEDRDEYMKNSEDEEIGENQGDEDDTREPVAIYEDPPRIP